MNVALHHGDCRTIIPTLGCSVDAIVTDPPYDLVSMTKRFGKPGSAPATSPDHGRFARGFMGQQWDGEGVAFDPETWRVVGSVLRPGGFLLAFGAPRTHHRMACAIEDAGFVIQDDILNLISSNTRVQKFVETLSFSQAEAFSAILDEMQPTGRAAWCFGTGFPKRRDMLKPAYESILCAYKPDGKRTLQVDECRISSEFKSVWSKSGSKASDNIAMSGANYARAPKPDNALGRWPANLCHDGSDEVVGLFPQTKSGNPLNRLHTDPGRNVASGASKGGVYMHSGFGDEGSAARFFFSSKAGSDDRFGSKHPTIKPVELMKWLVALVTPPGGTVLDPFAGSGTTGVAALATGRNCILIEREASYCEDIRARLAHYEGAGKHSLAAKGRKASPERSGAEGTPLFDSAALPVNQPVMAQQLCDTGDITSLGYSDD